jgi:hypothetical protein
MNGRFRRTRSLAPLLFGALLTSGCQLSGAGSAAVNPSGPFNLKGSGPGSGTATASGDAPLKDEAAAKRKPAVDPFAQPTDRRGFGASSTEPEGKEATTVSYIPPTTTSPYRAQAPNFGAAGQKAPASAGRVVTLTPGELRAEGDGDTATKTDARSDDVKDLDKRMQQLEQRLEQRDRAVRQSGAEVQAASEELRKTLTQVETWRKEMDEMRTTMRKRDREDIEMLKPLVERLQRELGEDAPAESRRDVP